MTQHSLRPQPKPARAKACPERSRTGRQEREEGRTNYRRHGTPTGSILGDLCEKTRFEQVVVRIWLARLPQFVRVVRALRCFWSPCPSCLGGEAFVRNKPNFGGPPGSPRPVVRNKANFPRAGTRGRGPARSPMPMRRGQSVSNKANPPPRQKRARTDEVFGGAVVGTGCTNRANLPTRTEMGAGR